MTGIAASPMASNMAAPLPSGVDAASHDTRSSRRTSHGPKTFGQVWASATARTFKDEQSKAPAEAREPAGMVESDHRPASPLGDADSNAGLEHRLVEAAMTVSALAGVGLPSMDTQQANVAIANLAGGDSGALETAATATSIASAVSPALASPTPASLTAATIPAAAPSPSTTIVTTIATTAAITLVTTAIGAGQAATGAQTEPVVDVAATTERESLSLTLGGPSLPTEGVSLRPRSVDSASSVQRIIDAVEVLRNQPPPRSLTLDLSDFGLGRIRVAVDGNVVRVTSLGDGGELLPDGWTDQLGGELASKGFVMDGGAADERDQPAMSESQSAAMPLRGSGRARSTTPETHRPLSAASGIRI